MLKLLQKLLIIVLLLVTSFYLLYQGFLYTRTRDRMPTGMTVAGIDVAGLTLEEVADLVNSYYMSPVNVQHREETIELNPADIGFQLDMETMLREAEIQSTPDVVWLGYLEFMLGRSFEPVEVELSATHDRTILLQHLEMLASFMDQPASGPRLVEETESYEMGRSGFITDIEGSLPAVEEALYKPVARQAQLVIVDQEAGPFDMKMLEESIQRQIQAFNGLGSFFIMDLANGEEMGINENVALSGLSVVKIAILLETFRALDFDPTSDQAKLIAETAVQSGNFSANLLLDIVAGQDNAYLGVDILTESMQQLGLENTFIATPYEEPDRPGKGTHSTPANSREDVTTYPDPTMQTTAEDMGTLLSMIYHCAKGGGTLLAVYPEQLTPEECQAIIDVLSQNEEGNLIRFGVPDGIKVSHKHGWAGNTHGDAGIVFSPGGDYIIVEYLAQPDTDWLVHEISFPLLREISRVVFNYFNVDAPFFGDTQREYGEGEKPESEPDLPLPPPDGGEFPQGIEAFRHGRQV
ncbi:MAG: serine hydrolase [Anaerolineaceae bacterium]|nr:MAG: serine hydrolase [Anaerolineaceae bacterium]